MHHAVNFYVPGTAIIFDRLMITPPRRRDIVKYKGDLYRVQYAMVVLQGEHGLENAFDSQDFWRVIMAPIDDKPPKGTEWNG